MTPPSSGSGGSSGGSDNGSSRDSGEPADGITPREQEQELGPVDDSSSDTDSGDAPPTIEGGMGPGDSADTSDVNTTATPGGTSDDGSGSSGGSSTDDGKLDDEAISSPGGPQQEEPGSGAIGLEVQDAAASDDARKIEERVVEQTDLDRDEIRVIPGDKGPLSVETSGGGSVTVFPTAELAEERSQQAAEQLKNVDESGVQTTVTPDLASESQLNQEGIEQVKEAVQRDTAERVNERVAAGAAEDPANMSGADAGPTSGPVQPDDVVVTKSETASGRIQFSASLSDAKRSPGTGSATLSPESRRAAAKKRREFLQLAEGNTPSISEFGAGASAAVGGINQRIQATQQAAQFDTAGPRQLAREYIASQRIRAKTGVSPILGLALDSDQYETAADAEEFIFERAEEGNLAARTYTGGEIIQNVGRDVGSVAKTLSPIDRVPVVGEGVERGLTMGLVEGPFVLSGAAAQAVSAPALPGDKGSAADVAKRGGEATVKGTKKTGEFAIENPVEAATLLATPYAIRGGTRAVRAKRSGVSSSGKTVKYSELRDPNVERGTVPEFQASTKASTKRAVGEVRQRAAEQPDAIQQAAGSDSVLYHTTGERLGTEVTVTEGGSELPGLFTAPDVNPVGLRSTSLTAKSQQAVSSLKPSLPKLSSDRIAVVETPKGKIKGMPESARGAGYEVRRPSGEVVESGLGRGQAKSVAEGTELQVRPDSSTKGYEFLVEDADPGTAYVRSQSRTPELEAILPPETRLVRTDPGAGVNVRVGGRRIPFTNKRIGGEKLPLDIYRRVNEGAEATAKPTDPATGRTAGDLATDYTPLSEVSAPRTTGTPASSYTSGLAGVSSATTTSATKGTSKVSEPATEPIPETTDATNATSSSSQPDSVGNFDETFPEETSETGKSGQSNGPPTSGSGSGTKRTSPPSKTSGVEPTSPSNTGRTSGSSTGRSGRSSRSTGSSENALRSEPTERTTSDPTSNPPSSPPGRPTDSPPSSPPSDPTRGPPENPTRSQPGTGSSNKQTSSSSNRKTRRFRQSDQSTEDIIEIESPEEEELVKRFEYNVASPGDVLEADSSTGGEDDLLDDVLADTDVSGDVLDDI